jgi:hypothetical protein
MTDDDALDALQAIAFIDMVRWAIGTPEIVERFSAETGFMVSIPTCAIDRMIDQASGYDADLCSRFMRWCETELWGEPMPQTVREMLDRKAASE